MSSRSIKSTKAKLTAWKEKTLLRVKKQTNKTKNQMNKKKGFPLMFHFHEKFVILYLDQNVCHTWRHLRGIIFQVITGYSSNVVIVATKEPMWYWFVCLCLINCTWWKWNLLSLAWACHKLKQHAAGLCASAEWDRAMFSRGINEASESLCSLWYSHSPARITALRFGGH